MKNKFSKKEKKMIVLHKKLSVLLFVMTMFIMSVLGILVNQRPTTSDVEKRQLTEFPTFTKEAFLSGSYFSDISLWYSDTFPFRDFFITQDQKIKSLYGHVPETRMVGGGAKGDEIPTENTEEIVVDQKLMDPTEAPTVDEMQAEIQNQIQQGLYVRDGAAFSMYYFNQTAAEIYIQALNQASEKLAGVANVYSLLVPNNSGVMLTEDEMEKFGGSDQEKAIHYYQSRYNGVTPIQTIETLKEHNDEYLYFRTDHHWTQLGAYYVYRNLCKEKEWAPNDLYRFEKMTFTPFLGTFYDKLKDATMEANPDTVEAYVPMGTNSMKYWNEEGEEINWHVITDVSNWNRASGYSCYIGGDRPLSIIENPEITDGSSCLVLKESYGNCFVPFLVDHYQTVYVVDFRYAKENVVEYVKQHQIQDLYIMNNITIIASDSVAQSIAGLL